MHILNKKLNLKSKILKKGLGWSKKSLAIVLILLLQASYFYLPLSRYFNQKSPIPKVEAANANGMVVYPVTGSNIPRYRAWDGSAFGTENNAAAAVSVIQYSVLQESPTRSEHILGTLANTGVITFQVENGSWGNEVSSTPGVGTTNDAYRGFDVAYEQLSGDGLVVYEDNSSANTDIKYNTWNGSAWGGEQSLTVNSANVLWVRMETKPLTNEIMLVTLDSNSDIYAYVWDGTQWGSGQLLTDAASFTTSPILDVAYENTSGDAMVAYGTGTTWDYWTYVGTTWTDGTNGSTCAGDGTTNACANVAGTVVNLNLSGSSENNSIAVAIEETTGDDFIAQVWDGTQWLAMPQAVTLWDEAGAVENAASEMAQNVVYEAAGNRFMFLYALNGTFAATYFFYDLDDSTWYNGDGTTSITDIDSVNTTTGNITTDDLAWINVKANPDDASQIMLTANDIDKVSRSRLWDGSSWSTPTNGDHGINTSSLIGGQAYFAWDRTLNVTTVGTSGSQNSTLAITATDKHVGGAFTLINSLSSANVTSIKISEKGNVNANSNLTNVKLLYKQEATCSSTVPAGTTQFGTTGTFNASDESTFTGTMSVGTSQICVYVTLDIGSGASAGQTVEIEITAPQSDVTSAANAIAPSTALAISGTSTLEAAALTVAASGTQKTEMGIPSDDNFIGASFTFVRNVGSTNVTSIKFTETNTVDADVELSNVDVYYKEEASCSETVPGDATLFNVSTGSFVAADTVTVTGTMPVDTDQTCVYFTLNVTSAADDADLFDIEITNPSTDVAVSSNTVTPATVIALSGSTPLVAPSYVSYGSPFLYTQANWNSGSGSSFTFEVYWKKTIGNVFARVWDETSSAEVTGSVVYISDSTFVRTRTGDLTLTDGHIYRAQLGHVTGASGEVYSAKLLSDGSGGGADLAEYYHSNEPLQLGEVVSIDSSKVAFVKGSSKPYQGDVLGAVSTQPGIILGANIGQSYPVALSGRVPVKVTTENGEIKVGDFVTSSSTKGFGMKATSAGRVLGQALESFDSVTTYVCPAGTKENIKCASVMVFVNLTNYFGQSIDIAMVQSPSANLKVSGLNIAPNSQTSTQGLTSADSDIFIPSAQAPDKESQILAFLEKSQQQASVSAQLSEIFTGRVSATSAVVAPLIVTDTLYAKKIKADSIEGLEFLINNGIKNFGATDSANLVSSESAQTKLTGKVAAGDIEGLPDLIASLIQRDVKGIATSSGQTTVVPDGLIALGPTTFGEASILDRLTVGTGFILEHNSVNVLGTDFEIQSLRQGGVSFLGGLVSISTDGVFKVAGQSVFEGDTVFKNITIFFAKAIFKSDVEFEKPPVFARDTAGTVVVKKSEDRAEVKFDTEYPNVPRVNTTLEIAEVKLLDGTAEESLVTEQRILQAGYSYVVSKKNVGGFAIVLNKKAAEDLTFSWTAIGAKESLQTNGSTSISATSPTGSASSPQAPTPTISETILLPGLQMVGEIAGVATESAQ